MAGSVIGALRVTLGLDSGPFARGASQAGRSLAGLRQNLVAVSAAMAAVGGAAFAMVAGTARAANEVARQAAIANTSADQFQRMAAAAATVGIQQDKLADILKDVNDRVGDFLQTGGGPMADFFENIAPQVGVTADMFRDLSGADALQLYVDTLQRAGVSQAEMTFYMEAMASDATALIPLLADNGAELERLGQIAADSGAIMSDELIASSKLFGEEMSEFRLRLQGVRNEIAERLLPVFTDMIAAINDNVMPAIRGAVITVGGWIDAFRELPGPIQEAVGIIATALGVGGPVLVAIGVVSTAFTALVGKAGPIGLLITAASAIMAVWTVWGDDIKAAVGPALEFIGNAFESVVSIIDGFIEKVGRAKDALLEFFRINSEVPEGFDQMLQGRFGQFRPGSESGGTSQSIQSGLLGEADQANAAGVAYGTAFADGVRTGLDIHSPSRVMAEIGGQAVAGLTEGIEGGAPGVAGAIGDIVGDAGDAFGGIADVLNQIKGNAQSAFAGLVRGTTSWSDALSGVLDRLADIAINSVFEGLWGSLVGTLTGGTAAFAGMGAGLRGFAEGGQFDVGGWGGVDSQLVAFRASPDETVTVTRPGQKGDAATRHVVEIHVPPGVTVSQAQQIAGEVAIQVVARASLQQDAAMPGRLADAQARGRR